MNDSVEWDEVLENAGEIMLMYDPGITLRQLFYRLVAFGVIPNKQSYYESLSHYTAEAQQEGWFPAFIDQTRKIHRPITFNSPTEAREWIAKKYRRDRTEGQEVNLYIGVEKNGLVEHLTSWFQLYGVPIVAVGRYASQAYIDEIADDILNDDRPSVLIYAGDFDPLNPSGEKIQRDFVDRVGLFGTVERIALTKEQVTEYDLPLAVGENTDIRARAFVEKYDMLVHVELDALAPDDLQQLYLDALGKYFDMSELARLMMRETEEQKALKPR